MFEATERHTRFGLVNKYYVQSHALALKAGEYFTNRRSPRSGSKGDELILSESKKRFLLFVGIIIIIIIIIIYYYSFYIIVIMHCINDIYYKYV